MVCPKRVQDRQWRFWESRASAKGPKLLRSRLVPPAGFEPALPPPEIEVRLTATVVQVSRECHRRPGTGRHNRTCGKARALYFWATKHAVTRFDTAEARLLIEGLLVRVQSGELRSRIPGPSSFNVAARGSSRPECRGEGAVQLVDRRGCAVGRCGDPVEERESILAGRGDRPSADEESYGAGIVQMPRP